MKSDIEKCKELFESILCLCSEGPEFHTKMELMDAVLREAREGFSICRGTQQAVEADAIFDPVCRKCGDPLTTDELMCNNCRIA